MSESTATPPSTPSHIWFLLDRSGSMEPLREAVVEGFAEFITEQQADDDGGRITLVQFDSTDPQEVVIDGVPVREVLALTAQQFVPRGSTPLLDAIGQLVERVDGRIAAGADPADQLVVIFTDGYENASVHFSARQVSDLIDDRRRSGWTFVFLGANQDSFRTASTMGMAAGSTANWTADATGARDALRRTSRSTLDYKRSSRRQRLAQRDRFFDNDAGGETISPE